MNDYIKQAMQFDQSDEQYALVLQRLQEPQMVRLLHALVGMTTEVGELFDQFKKHCFYGKDLDLINLAEEISDVDWYRAVAIDALSILLDRDSLELEDHIDRINIAKLSERYKKGFSNESALNRDLEAERKILDGIDTQSEKMFKTGEADNANGKKHKGGK